MRFGIVGLGEAGWLHCLGLERIREGRLVAICDPDPQRLAEAASRFRPARASRSVDEVLAADEIDAVCLCVPHHLHCPETLLALERGKHVLCEKPLALRLDEADAMIARARQSARVLGVVQQYRHRPAWRAARQALEQVGRPLQVILTLITPRPETYYTHAAWRGEHGSAGGGVLINQAIHHVDFLAGCLGRPLRVLAKVANLRHWLDVEDTCWAVLEFPGGCTAHLIVSTAPAAPSFRMEFAGDRGTVGITDTEAWLAEPGLDRPRPLPLQRRAQGHVATLREFIQRVRAGAVESTDLDEGRLAVEIVNAAYLSAWQGREVELPLDPQEYRDAWHRRPIVPGRRGAGALDTDPSVGRIQPGRSDS